MDTFAALALATDPPTLELLNRKPERKGASIITFNMWKMIFAQAILQLVITFVLNFAGLNFHWMGSANMPTVTFNTFVWLQIFNEVNCRRLDDKLNVSLVSIEIHSRRHHIHHDRRSNYNHFRLVEPHSCHLELTWSAMGCINRPRLSSLPVGALIRLIPKCIIDLSFLVELLDRKRKTAL